MQNEDIDSLAEVGERMKRDWDSRASENARWYINTLSHQQTEEEFDLSGRREFEGLLVPDLAILTDRRPPASLKFLEIGCGIGRMTRFIAAVFGDVVAIDVSAEMVRQARARLGDLPNALFEETNGIDFRRFPDESFDVVFAAYVFQHVPDAEVIESNIRDAYRLLKPRGVFKFVVNSVIEDGGTRRTGDTWAGASFPMARVRELAAVLGGQLLGGYGDGTQYCWSLLRKRSTDHVSQDAEPRITFAGRADDMVSTDLAPRVGDAYVGMLVDGIDFEDADINNLTVAFGERQLIPMYCGPTAVPASAVIDQQPFAFDPRKIQVSVCIPPSEPAGEVEVSVRLANGQSSHAVRISLPAIAALTPVIDVVINTMDKGMDIWTTGSKSDIRVLFHVDQLKELGEVTIALGQERLRPRELEFLSANGVWQATLQLPENIQPGVLSISVILGETESIPYLVDVRAATVSP